MRGTGVFTLVMFHCDSDGACGCVASINAFVLLQVWEVGPSAGAAVTEFMWMLVSAASFLGTSTNHDRQSAALFHAPDIHLKVMFYVVNSSDHQFTLLFVFLSLKNFCRGLWALHMTMSDPWR